MPIPLFLYPAYYVASTAFATGSTATAVGVSTATLVEVGVGSAVAGGTGVGFFWWWFHSTPTTAPSIEHQDLLEAQRIAIVDRINMANHAVEQLCQDSINLNETIQRATLSSSLSSEHLHQLAESLSTTSLRLTTAITFAKECNEEIAGTMPELNQLSENVRQLGLEAIQRMIALKASLDLKGQELRMVNTRIIEMSAAMSEQTESISHLSHVVKEQKATIKHLTEKVVHLEAVADNYKRNCQFFKRVAQEALATSAPADKESFAIPK